MKSKGENRSPVSPSPPASSHARVHLKSPWELLITSATKRVSKIWGSNERKPRGIGKHFSRQEEAAPRRRSMAKSSNSSSRTSSCGAAFVSRQGPRACGSCGGNLPGGAHDLHAASDAARSADPPLHYNLKTPTALESLKDLYSDRQSVAKSL